MRQESERFSPIHELRPREQQSSPYNSPDNEASCPICCVIIGIRTKSFTSINPVVLILCALHLRQSNAPTGDCIENFISTQPPVGYNAVFILNFWFSINAAPRHNPFKFHLMASALGLQFIYRINASPRHNPFKFHLMASALGLQFILN